MKNKFLLMILLIIASCSKTNKYSTYIQGEWQIEEFYHKGKDVGSKYHYHIGFQEYNLWIHKMDHTDNAKSTDYEINKISDTLKLKIQGYDEKWLDGVYDLHIDTIEKRLTVISLKLY